MQMKLSFYIYVGSSPSFLIYIDISYALLPNIAYW